MASPMTVIYNLPLIAGGSKKRSYMTVIGDTPFSLKDQQHPLAPAPSHPTFSCGLLFFSFIFWIEDRKIVNTCFQYPPYPTNYLALSLFSHAFHIFTKEKVVNIFLAGMDALYK
jgi:hypothetical protein